MTNYFELYGIGESFHPDADLVKKKFYELSRKYHPDRAVLGDESGKSEALRMSALNNEAYRTLRDSDATMAYILRLHGVLEAEEKYNLPPDFLMEMMELNEAVSAYEQDPGNEELERETRDSLQAYLRAWEEAAGPLTERFDAGGAGDAQRLLADIKDYYFRRKYLLRIQERMDRFATRRSEAG